MILMLLQGLVTVCSCFPGFFIPFLLSGSSQINITILVSELNIWAYRIPGTADKKGTIRAAHPHYVPPPPALIIGMKHHLVDLYQVCSNYSTWSKNPITVIVDCFSPESELLLTFLYGLSSSVTSKQRNVVSMSRACQGNILNVMCRKL